MVGYGFLSDSVPLGAFLCGPFMSLSSLWRGLTVWFAWVATPFLAWIVASGLYLVPMSRLRGIIQSRVRRGAGPYAWMRVLYLFRFVVGELAHYALVNVTY